MTGKRTAHRTDFTVRCACGIEYHSDDAHAGRTIRCRCGRTVVIERPKDDVARRATAASAVGSSSGARTGAPKAGAARARTSGVRSSGVPLGAQVRGALLRSIEGARTLGADALFAMGSRRFVRRWSARAAWLALVLAMVAWGMLAFMSERFLPATLLAYGPRFLLLVPMALLVPFVIATARPALLPLGAAILIVLGPIMGGRVSLRTLGRSWPATPPPGTLRVISFNAFGGAGLAPRLDEMLELKPDLIAVQECGETLGQRLERIPGWHFARHHGLCTVSRWPIASTDSMPRNDLARLSRAGLGGSGLLVRYLISTPNGPLVLANLHLETARKGLEGFTSGEGLVPTTLQETENAISGNASSAQGERLEINTLIRDRESERASLWAVRGDKSTPTLVAGDFNLPVESTIYRRHWSDYRDAFERAGTGFGWSKIEGALLRIRIDHILGNAAAPRPVGAWVGPDFGSDHRPVIADFRWR